MSSLFCLSFFFLLSRQSWRHWVLCCKHDWFTVEEARLALCVRIPGLGVSFDVDCSEHRSEA
jgi:hypothetical protein